MFGKGGSGAAVTTGAAVGGGQLPTEHEKSTLGLTHPFAWSLAMQFASVAI
jgi:hypothetical protein